MTMTSYFSQFGYKHAVNVVKPVTQDLFGNDNNDNDKVFYSTLIIHFIFNTAIDVFAY